jgi:hypothetical protein
VSERIEFSLSKRTLWCIAWALFISGSVLLGALTIGLPYEGSEKIAFVAGILNGLGWGALFKWGPGA